jgi:hypothetical protein
MILVQLARRLSELIILFIKDSLAVSAVLKAKLKIADS